MFLNPKRCFRVLAVLIALGCTGPLGKGQKNVAISKSDSLRTSASKSPEAVAALLWDALLTKCPSPGESGGVATYYLESADRKTLGILAPRRLGMVFELRNPWTKLFPEELTAADRLNNIHFKGQTVLGFAAFRSIASDQGTQWSSLEVGTTKRPNSLKTPLDIGGLDNTTSFEIEQRNGKWTFDRKFELNDLPKVSAHLSRADLARANQSAK